MRSHFSDLLDEVKAAITTAAETFHQATVVEVDDTRATPQYADLIDVAKESGYKTDQQLDGWTVLARSAAGEQVQRIYIRNVPVSFGAEVRGNWNIMLLPILGARKGVRLVGFTLDSFRHFIDLAADKRHFISVE